jgi:alkylation response protein AidB-like acyl-CoA dehydrogenase
VTTAGDVWQILANNPHIGTDGESGALAERARFAEAERALRDARLGPIGGGSDEIMKEIIGRQLGL